MEMFALLHFTVTMVIIIIKLMVKTTLVALRPAG